MARTLSGRLTTGGLVILIGVLALLSTTGTVDTESLWAWVPAVFVLLGAWALVASDFRNLTGPVMVIVIAGAYLARNLGVVPDDAIATWWPLFLVLFGVLLLVGRSRRRDRAGVPGTDEAGELTSIAIFGGSERRVTSDRFTGAEVLALFGGAEIDLRDAGIAQRPAVVEVLAAFGGAEVHVPREWEVRLDVLAIFGGVEDSRARVAPAAADDDGADRPRGTGTAGGSGGEPDLVVTGLALFGGVDVTE